jgi:glycosyltransferase involved in cell wall biosynthesis
VLHVVATYLPATRYGGPIQSVHGLAKAQAALGADVSVLTTSVDGPNDSPVPHAQAVLLDGVKIWYFPSRFLRKLYFSWAMWRWLKAHITQFDVVHLHAVFLFPTNMAARVCVAAGVPYLIAPRGMLVPELIQGRSTWLKRAWIACFERATLAHAACFHATSDLEISDAKRLGVPVQQPALLFNGVDAPNQDMPTSDVLPGAPYVLFLGRLVWKKNIHLLIEACARLPELRLVIAGADEDATQAKLEQLCRARNVVARVQFLGELKGDAKWHWLKNARALALVSTNENFGNAAAEAMLVGTPVIVSEGVGLADAVLRERAGWVCQSNLESVSQALSAVFEAPEDAHTRGKNAQAWAERTLSWPGIAAQSLALYVNLCANRPFT